MTQNRLRSLALGLATLLRPHTPVTVRLEELLNDVYHQFFKRPVVTRRLTMVRLVDRFMAPAVISAKRR